MKILLAVVQLIILLSCTVGLLGQTRYQETRDAVQDQRLDYMERSAAAQTARLTELALKFEELGASMNRFTGIGIGIGSTLTILQVLQVILQLKKPGGK